MSGSCAARRLSSPISGAAAVLVVWGVLVAPRLLAAEGAPAPAYSHAPPDVVVRYVEMPGELAEAAGGPTLTVHGDGRATVHYPPYMRRAGDHTTTLARAEVDALVASLVAKGVAQFDVPAVHSEIRAGAAARAALTTGSDAGGVLVAVTDPSTTTIELALAAAAPAGAAAPATLVVHRAEWHGLRGDAAEHPGVRALTDLLAARDELRALMERVHGTPAP